jgi:hypothetical protein
LLEIDNWELLGLGVCALLLFGVSWVSGRFSSRLIVAPYAPQRVGAVEDEKAT